MFSFRHLLIWVAVVFTRSHILVARCGTFRNSEISFICSVKRTYYKHKHFSSTYYLSLIEWKLEKSHTDFAVYLKNDEYLSLKTHDLGTYLKQLQRASS